MIVSILKILPCKVLLTLMPACYALPGNFVKSLIAVRQIVQDFSLFKSHFALIQGGPKHANIFQKNTCNTKSPVKILYLRSVGRNKIK